MNVPTQPTANTTTATMTIMKPLLLLLSFCSMVSEGDVEVRVGSVVGLVVGAVAGTVVGAGVGSVVFCTASPPTRVYRLK